MKHTSYLELGKLDPKLRCDPEHVESITKHLQLTDPDDIAWVSILLGNLRRAASLGCGAVAIPVSAWKSLDLNDPEQARIVRLLRKLEESGLLRRRYADATMSILGNPKG